MLDVRLILVGYNSCKYFEVIRFARNNTMQSYSLPRT